MWWNKTEKLTINENVKIKNPKETGEKYSNLDLAKIMLNEHNYLSSQLQGVYVNYPKHVDLSGNSMSKTWESIKDKVKYLKENIRINNFPKVSDLKKYLDKKKLWILIKEAIKEELWIFLSIKWLKNWISEILNWKFYNWLEKILTFIWKNFPITKSLSIWWRILTKIIEIIKLNKVKIEHKDEIRESLPWEIVMWDVYLKIKKNNKIVRRIWVSYFYDKSSDGRHIYVTNLWVNHPYFKKMWIWEKLINYIKTKLTVKKWDTITLVNAAKDINTWKKLHDYYRKQGFKRMWKTEIWTKK